jgi:hypothetical protein
VRCGPSRLGQADCSLARRGHAARDVEPDRPLARAAWEWERGRRR